MKRQARRAARLIVIAILAWLAATMFLPAGMGDLLAAAAGLGAAWTVVAFTITPARRQP